VPGGSVLSAGVDGDCPQAKSKEFAHEPVIGRGVRTDVLFCAMPIVFFLSVVSLL